MSRAPSGRFARWLAAGFLVICVLIGRGPNARAEAASSPGTPADAPSVQHAGPLALPPLPVTYQVQKLGWWTLSYPASARERVQSIIAKADDWKAGLASDFGQAVLAEPIEVRIGRSWEDMAALVPKELGVPPYASGVTYAPLRLVYLTLTEPSGGEATDLETVFRHELSHVALEDVLNGLVVLKGARHYVPRWFNEGLAIHESGEHPWLRMRELWDATLFRQLLALSELDAAFSATSGRVNLAYAESADVVRFLLRGQERLRFVSLMDRLRSGEAFDQALGDAYGTDVRKLEFQWREECAKRNTFAPMLASGSFVWVLGFGALLVGYQRRKRQTRATLARWELEERALDLPKPTSREEEQFADVSRVPVGLPKVEHEGDWHTLH